MALLLTFQGFTDESAPKAVLLRHKDYVNRPNI